MASRVRREKGSNCNELPFSYLNYFSVSLILVCTSPVFILLLSEKRNKSPSIILSDIRNSFCARLMSACASFW